MVSSRLAGTWWAAAVLGPDLLPRLEVVPAADVGAVGTATGVYQSPLGSYQSYQACHSGLSRFTLDASDSVTDECWAGRWHVRRDLLGGISEAKSGLSARTGGHGLSHFRRVSIEPKVLRGTLDIRQPPEGQ